jgi:protein involved in polysaccharide export with SLBB domain
MKKFKTIVYFIFICFFVIKASAQSFSQIDENRQSALSILGLDQAKQSVLAEFPTSEMMIASVNEHEYHVDAGDVFILKIDVEGPASKVFNSIVTSDGFLVIPDVPSIPVQNLTLKAAKNKINQILTKYFPRAHIEAHLLQIHPIHVTILGALPRPGKITIRSSDRLFDAVSTIIQPQIADTTIDFEWKTISFRNVEIKRRHGFTQYDLLKFRLTGDITQNPYLMDEDIVYINYQDTLEHNISVSGAVGSSIEVEYKQGDSLGLALDFASGLLPTADSSRIELVRLETNADTFFTKFLKFPDDSGYQLLPDDRIYVRKKLPLKNSDEVLVRGEVKYPGIYAIESGESKLSEVIKRAGGFTD